MITVVSGKIGAGKSYDMTRLICRHIRRGGVVATNMELHRDAIAEYALRPVLDRQLLRIDQDVDPAIIPRGDFRGTRDQRKVIVVLDEALNWFQTSSTKADARKESWSMWLRQSDKLGQQVYFIAQNFERAAKWIRELAQVSRDIYPVKGLKIWNWIPIGLIIPFGSRAYVVAVVDVRAGRLIGYEAHLYSKALYRCYETAALYGFTASRSAYADIWPPFLPSTLWYWVPACLAAASVLLTRYF